MSKKVTIMTDKEFEKKLSRLAEKIQERKKLGHDYNANTNYLVGRVTGVGAPFYTPEQLRKIFDLT